MQTILLSCLFGAVGAMVLCVAASASAVRDHVMRRGRYLPPEEL